LILNWDGKERYKKYKFNKRIKYAQIDPNYINWMDLNMINNSMAAKEPTKAAAKVQHQNAFLGAEGFVLFWGVGMSSVLAKTTGIPTAIGTKSP
jgi:hypothetical protein